MRQFKVISAVDFVAASDFRGDAIRSRIEVREKEQREAQAQRRREDYQTRRDRMTPGERLQDEINMLNEWITDSAKNTARVEAVYQKLTKHSGGGSNGSR